MSVKGGGKMTKAQIGKNVSINGTIWGLLAAVWFYLFYKLGLSEIHSAIVVLSMILGGFFSLLESYAVDIVSAIKENE